MFSYRRVKHDERDAADLADLLRMGRLPEAWIARQRPRELRAGCGDSRTSPPSRRAPEPAH